MIEDIKKLKKLLNLKEKNEAQVNFEGFTIKTLDKAIKEQKNKVKYEINGLGWFFVFLIVIPLALMQLGMSIELAGFVSYISGGIITMILTLHLH